MSYMLCLSDDCVFHFELSVTDSTRTSSYLRFCGYSDYIPVFTSFLIYNNFDSSSRSDNEILAYDFISSRGLECFCTYLTPPSRGECDIRPICTEYWGFSFSSPRSVIE